MQSMVRSFIGLGRGRLLNRIAELFRSSSTGPSYGAIIASIIAIAVVDSLTPLSLDEWMLYYIPLVLSFALFEPALPIGIAFAATILIIVASVVSPPGLDPRIEAINRGLGVTGLWVTAVLGYLFIRGKLTLREQSAMLRAANEQLQTEMKLRAETQAALDQAQRMEVVGQLAGGLAHDINNMLTVVTGGIELATQRIEDDKAREFLGRARQAVDMGAKLNRQLLTFARRRKLDPVRFNLNQHVADVSKLLERSVGAQATLSMELASDPSIVTVDPGEVDNTLLNLVINSRDAMPSGGALKIETHDITLDAATAAGIPDAYAGEFVCLSVSDSGHGMAPEVLCRAVEPFFTTKEPDKGTGLGLSSVYGFARQSGGFLNITSDVGKGTSVSIFLPRAA
jgi:signal transduction histidine kinase